MGSVRNKKVVKLVKILVKIVVFLWFNFLIVGVVVWMMGIVLILFIVVGNYNFVVKIIIYLKWEW